MDTGDGSAHGEVMALLLLSVDPHLHAGARDPAAYRRHRLHRDAGQEAVHGLEKVCFLLLIQQLIEGGGQHIACCAHIAFQIQRFHWIPSI